MTNLIENMQETVGDLVYFSRAFSFAEERYIKECDKPSGEYDNAKANQYFSEAVTYCNLSVKCCETLGFDTGKILRDCVRFQEAYKSQFKK